MRKCIESRAAELTGKISMVVALAIAFIWMIKG